MLCETYLLQRSGAEPEEQKDVVVAHEGVGDTDNDQCPLREEEHRFAADVVGQRREQYRAEYHADDENCLRQVFEVFTVADQVELESQHADVTAFHFWSSAKHRSSWRAALLDD